MIERTEKALKRLLSHIKEDREFYKNNVRELLKAAGRKKPKKALYTAAFLDEGSREDLYNWWKMHVKKDLLERVPKHSHMTIKFKPSPDDVLSLPIGESQDKTITVIGYAENELGQAVQVRVSDESFSRQDEKVAHVTISAAEDAPMGFAYSNELLSNGVTEVKAGPTLNVKIGLFRADGEVRFDLEGTMYEDLGSGLLGESELALSSMPEQQVLSEKVSGDE
jgi:hypothetical protein